MYCDDRDRLPCTSSSIGPVTRVEARRETHTIRPLDFWTTCIRGVLRGPRCVLYEMFYCFLISLSSGVVHPLCRRRGLRWSRSDVGKKTKHTHRRTRENTHTYILTHIYRAIHLASNNNFLEKSPFFKSFLPAETMFVCHKSRVVFRNLAF